MNIARGVRSVTTRTAVVACSVVLVVVLGGCEAGVTPQAVSSPGASAERSAQPSQPEASPSPSTDGSPDTKPTAPPTDPPADTPPPSATVSASGSPAAGPGAACSGTVENKAFWSQASAWLTFDVYCPVLPDGWYLTAASFETKDGGLLTAGFAGPGGASVQLKEGKFCTDGVSACTPHDTVLGTAAFGDRTGSLYSLGPGIGYAIYIDPGKAPSWSITGSKMTQSAFTSIAAALAKVPKS